MSNVVARALDSMVNLFTGFGTTVDRSTATTYLFRELSQQQLEAAYRSDWVARKGIDIPAFDATREWRAWQAPKDQITAIERVERDFDVRRKVFLAMVKARLYGGAGIIIGTSIGRPDEPLRVDQVGRGGLQYLHVLSRHELVADASHYYNDDVNSPLFGLPEFYDLRLGGTGQPTTRVHTSRIVKFIGNSMPNRELMRDGWGDPVLNAIDDAVKGFGTVSHAIASMIHEAKFDIIKLPGFNSEVGAEDYRSRVTTRFTYARQAKSTINALLMDKDEEWQRVAVDFSGMPDVLKVYMLMVCSALDIPATRFLGQSPVGLSATGESDTRNYYDRIGADQNTIMRPTLVPLDEVIIRSATGGRDEAIYYDWNSLWQMSDSEVSDIESKRASTFKVDVDAGLIDPEVLRKARINQLNESGFYPGLAVILEASPEPDDETGDPDDLATLETAKLAASVEPQKQALNGAQITSIKEVVVAVGTGEMPPETATALIRVAFPAISEVEVRAIIDPMDGFERPAPRLPPPSPSAPPPRGGLPALLDSHRGRLWVRDASGAKRQMTASDGIAPRSLYVRRDVLNARDLIAWAREQGFETTVPAQEMHVTVAFSRTPVDWMAMGQWYDHGTTQRERAASEMIVPAGGPRVVEAIGQNGEATVLMFASSDLAYRHESMIDRGASWDWDDYTPHVTITWRRPAGLNPRDVEPYRGPLILGPEVFEEINDDWRGQLEEVPT